MSVPAESPPSAPAAWPRAELWLWGAAAAAVGFALLFQLGEVQAGLTPDEAVAGYNARALDHTLGDEWGVTLPLYFRGIGDYRDPIYIYVAAVTEGVFGPTPFAVRLPAALFGFGLSVGLFFLLRALTGRARLARWLALLSLLVPSIFFFSRTAMTNAISLPCLLVLALFALWRLEQAPRWPRAALAGAAFGLCTYSYSTARMLAPVLVAVTLVCLAIDPRLRRQVLPFAGSAAILGLPMGLFMLLHPGVLQQRLGSMSVLSRHPGVAAAGAFFETYAQHLLSLDFLFKSGRGPGQFQDLLSIGDGCLPLWLWIPLVFGLYGLWQRRQQAFIRVLAVACLLSPIPVALTTENLPHTSRILHLVPLLFVIGSLGIADWIASAAPARPLLVLATLAAFYEGGLMLEKYFVAFGHAYHDRGANDDSTSEAFLIALRARAPGAPIFLPERFFDWDGLRLRYLADAVGAGPNGGTRIALEELGVRRLPAGEELPAGAIAILPGTQAPGQPADRLGIAARFQGGPFWSVYRLRAPGQ